MNGVVLYQLESFKDRRGALISLEAGMNLPFPMQRFFIVYPEPGSVRAEHASSAEELIIVMSGSLQCDLDNGSEQQTIHVSAASPALWLRPGVWLRLRDFATGTVFGVAASKTYADTVQSPRPMGELLARASGVFEPV